MLVRASSLHLKSTGSLSLQWIWIRSLSSKDVRSKFIKFFEDEGHQYFPSSSIIPKKGDGTYFTNSGMNQFKPLFLGQCDPSSKLWGLKRAVNSQKCIRVGGKHNDLEDVGHDLTHHTFFEMMGSWSFGDYFKKEACAMAHELLTQRFSIPEDRLYFTYFGGDQTVGLPADEECYEIWASLGIPRERILPFGVKDNFWDMGVTGPCGPCSEIHYDHVGDRYAGSLVNLGSPEVVEIWNLVFMQFNRQVDQSLIPLPSQHVDTGMGLERMVAVMNGTSDNYNTDLFHPLFDIVQMATKYKPYQGQLTKEDTAYRMLADHSRMLTVSLSDGLLPSNDNLGHKVRIILHKCIQLCLHHFQTDPNILLPALVKGVVTSLEAAYPELSQNQEKVIDIVTSGIGHYHRTMEQATRSFQKMLTRKEPTKVLSGEVISALEKGYFGSAMSLETIGEIADSHGMELDMQSYQRHVKSTKEESELSPPTASPQAPIHNLVNLLIEQGRPVTDDVFKYHFSASDGTCDFSSMAVKTSPCSIKGMLGCEGQISQQLSEGQKGEVILDKTCFYAEGGGQEADKGFLQSQTGIFQVEDVQNHRGYIVHSGYVTQGFLAVGQNITPEISTVCRQGNMRNHTGTHILNAALLSVLPSTQQEGSNVNSDRFTFDFLALTKVDLDCVEYLESRVKEIIRESHPVTSIEMSLAEAMASPHVRRIQNEDYPEEVRVVTIGHSEDQAALSKELCGGTHVLNTSDVEEFCITGLSARSQHVKRVTCVTGPQAKQAYDNGQIVDEICSLLKHLHNVVNGKTSIESVVEAAHILTTKAKQKLLTIEQMSDDELARTKDEMEKTQTLLHLLCDDLKLLQNNPSLFSVETMKKLVDRIHQCQHLELLPKTVRHKAYKTLQDMEHKVQALINAGKAASLKQALAEVEIEEDYPQPHIISVDADMNPRQVLKVLNQKPPKKPVILIQDVGSIWNIIFSLPCSSHKSHSSQDMGELLKVLQGFGSAKGKVASEKQGHSLWRLSLKGESVNRVILETELLKWLEEKK